MWKRGPLLLILSLASAAQAVDKLSAPQPIALAKSNAPGLRDAIIARFDAKSLKDGTAWLGHGADFLFAIDSPAQPSLVIGDGAVQPMQHLAPTDLWYAIATIGPVGKSHAFRYMINSAKFGGSLDMSSPLP